MTWLRLKTNSIERFEKYLIVFQRRDEARFEACPVVLLGHLYLIGGYITSKDEPTNTVVKLDLRKPEEGWKKIASMKYPRRKAKATRHTSK